MGFQAAQGLIKQYCRHCGEFIGYITKFQEYEERVAQWLQGEVSPPMNEGFDVFHCKPFPAKTFQVKFASVYNFGGKTSNRHSTKTWSYNQAKWNERTRPDYFVLIGVGEDQSEYIFLLSQDQFLRHASHNSTGGYIFQCSIRKNVRRGTHQRGYYHTPFIWQYEVRSPESNLVNAVLEREKLLEFERSIIQPALMSLAADCP